MSTSAPPEPSARVEPRRASDVFSRDEIKALTRTSNAAGAWAIASTWAIIAATFAVMARWPHPVVIAIGIVVLGGRQLGLGVLMHEAAHGTLFRTKWANDVLTDVLCARVMGTDVARYRKHHLAHHSHTGTERDPDLGLAWAEPVTRASLARKLLRDVFGVAGLKRLLGLVLIDAGVLEYNVGGDAVRAPWRCVGVHAASLVRKGLPAFVTNALLFTALAATGHAWLYATWAIAWLTTYGLFLRVRSIAEHACMDRTNDPFRNTRTTRASWLARLTVAPLHVNFHLAHHLLPTVPWQTLPVMQRLLEEKGAMPEQSFEPDYVAVMRAASSARM